MGRLNEAIRSHHRELEAKLGQHVEAIVNQNNSGAGADAFIAYLKQELLPHATSEERELYPMVDELVRKHGRPTATMSVDHEAIADLAGRFAQAAAALRDAPAERRAALAQSLRDLAIRLDAVIRLHLSKEERAYLPLVEQHVSADEQHRALERLHAAYHGHH